MVGGGGDERQPHRNATAGVAKRRGVLITTLRHELAHVLIDALSNNRAVRWLEEGFAIYLAGEGALISNTTPTGRDGN